MSAFFLYDVYFDFYDPEEFLYALFRKAGGDLNFAIEEIELRVFRNDVIYK